MQNPPPPHAYSSMVIPWIVPRVPPCIENWIRAKSQRRSYKARDVLLNETQPYDRLFFISSGVVAQGVVDASLYTKPLAINLFTGGRLMGTLNIITAVPSPRKLIALTDVEVYICSHRLVREELLTDLDLTLALMGFRPKASSSAWKCFFRWSPKNALRFSFRCSFFPTVRLTSMAAYAAKTARLLWEKHTPNFLTRCLVRLCARCCTFPKVPLTACSATGHTLRALCGMQKAICGLTSKGLRTHSNGYGSIDVAK